MKESTDDEIVKTKDLVIQILKNDERARNDDKWLVYKVYSHYTKIYIPFADFQKLPPFETVSRIRRTLQNDEGLYLPTIEEVKRRRGIREEDFKRIFGNKHILSKDAIEGWYEKR